ncbi:MAG: hypothetical protein JWN01_535 [Patescibacteria group bacterium]|nr:hypothetical protein [Patescibacteria group bacterium]
MDKATEDSKKRIKQTVLVLEELLSGLPLVSMSRKFNNTNFTVGGKVFAFTKNEGLTLKLPAEMTDALIKHGRAERLVMGGRAMKEWVTITHTNPKKYEADIELINAAIKFTKGTDES